MRAFTDVWLTLAGSSIPLRGEPNALALRPSPFLGMLRRATGRPVEDHGLMLVPGSPDARNAFIAVRDVAVACAAAVEREDLQDRGSDVAGPEVLTWRQVAKTLGRMLHRNVRVLGIPSEVYAAAAAALKPVSEAASSTMALNRLVATAETPWTEPGGGLVDPAGMTTVKEYLTEKLALPDTAPV